VTPLAATAARTASVMSISSSRCWLETVISLRMKGG